MANAQEEIKRKEIGSSTQLPLVTINILSFNRATELRNTLRHIFAQSYKNIEVIVVDNASSDNTVEIVSQEYPAVKLIPRTKNVGISGWNDGFRIAHGDYILVLDDDSYPECNSIVTGVKTMMQFPEVGIISYNIFSTLLKRSETSKFRSENPFLFQGCGALFRKETIFRVGYYDELFFIYYNEIDYTIRCYEQQIRVRYLDECRIIHTQTPLARTSGPNGDPYTSETAYRHYFIGHLIFLVKHFDTAFALTFGLKWILNRMIILFKYRYFQAFFSVLVQLPRVVLAASKKRKPVRRSIQQYYAYGNKPLVDRFFYPNFRKPFA
ncbi:MAG TPA: glycosyltransferase [Nitrosomonas sp.]|nr:glycosyltransferase [Nitrosomonas sp.]